MGRTPRKDHLRDSPKKEKKEKSKEISPEKETAKTVVTAHLEVFSESSLNCVEFDDFDFRVRRFLYALYNKQGKARLEEGLNMLQTFVS